MSNSETIHMRTPLVLSQELSSLNEGANVYLKLDNLQPSGSFKIRGVGYMAVEVNYTTTKCSWKYIFNVNVISNCTETAIRFGKSVNFFIWR